MEFHPEGTIATLAPTVAALFRVEPPALCAEPPLPAVMRAAMDAFGDLPVERALIVCPDALGYALEARHPGPFQAIEAAAPLRVRVRSVLPPKTPVCYASVFTGAPPSSHGIRAYEKPVLSCDTLFDALPRAGVRCAIVAVADSSIERIFRGRDCLYHSEPDDAAVAARVEELLEADAADCVVAYLCAYDDALHATEPFSDRAVAALRAHAGEVVRLGEAHRAAYPLRRRFFAVVPDHGAHVDPATGRGDHGLDRPDDMDLHHFYALSSD